MCTEMLVAFFLTDWVSAATYEFTRYFNHMSITQWGIISAACVGFGFLCLRGTPLER